MDTLTKSNWLKAVKSLATSWQIKNVNESLQSPTFTVGDWKIAIEHQRQYRSVVLRWNGTAEELPSPEGNWQNCPPSDCRKGWSYRVQLLPNELKLLLSQLKSQSVSSELWNANFQTRIEQSRTDNREDRVSRLAVASAIPRQVSATVKLYVRNPDVVVETLHRANGICEACGDHAPFIRRSDGTPYLEVHHRIQLAEGGEDTLDNTMALCPNCHRRAHFGQQCDETIRLFQ